METLRKQLILQQGIGLRLGWVVANCPTAPVGIILLMPPLGCKLKQPSLCENDKIQSEISKLGLNEIKYKINKSIPEVDNRTRTVEPALHIRRDGTIWGQDTSGEIINFDTKQNLTLW